MAIADLIGFLDFSRQKTLGLLDTLAKDANAQAILGWRSGWIVPMKPGTCP